MIAGKHYVSYEAHQETGLMLGVMRPGEAMQSASSSPLEPEFFLHFTRLERSVQYNNTVSCCMYCSLGYCHSHDWRVCNTDRKAWHGMESLSGSFKVGMLLDLDEGTLSVYNNGTKLGVMKRGLAGQYCWVCIVARRNSTVPAS